MRPQRAADAHAAGRQRSAAQLQLDLALVEQRREALGQARGQPAEPRQVRVRAIGLGLALAL